MKTIHYVALAGALAIGLAIASQARADEAKINWTGAYAGAHVGYGWGDVSQTQDNGGMPYGPYGYDVDGVFGGGTLGYNYQMGPIVVGVEGDLGYMQLEGAGIIPSSNPAAHQDITLDGGLYATVTGRAGVLITPALLAYGKGGFAFYDGDARQQTTNPGYVTHGSGSFTGWTAGAGLEYMVSDNLSIKVEYLHFDFGTEHGDQTSISDPPINYVYRNSSKLDADTVKLGVAWHF